jgi:hypothetical protein
VKSALFTVKAQPQHAVDGVLLLKPSSYVIVKFFFGSRFPMKRLHAAGSLARDDVQERTKGPAISKVSPLTFKTKDAGFPIEICHIQNFFS